MRGLAAAFAGSTAFLLDRVKTAILMVTDQLDAAGAPTGPHRCAGLARDG